MRIERRPLEPVQVIVRADPVIGYAEIFHSDTGLPVQRLGIPMREILRMVGGVGGDVLAQGKADGLAAEETAERVAHPSKMSWIGRDGKEARSVRHIQI